MEGIEVKKIKLMNLHASINQENIVYDPKKVQAMLQVQYDFKDPIKKIISYRVVIGENQENGLYHVKCDYSFEVDDNDYIDQEVVKVVMNILQPRIEELLAVITLEAGYSELDKN